MSASSSSSRRAALSLYSHILRLHRQKLPFEMRQLGDTYVRKEFRLHKKADAKFVQSFFAEWRHYAATLEAQQTLEVVGEALDPQMLGTLSDEQRAQLAKLRQEAQALS